MWLNRLPGDYRRRYYTNLGFIAGLIIVFTNAWRLGPHGLAYVILALFGLGMMYLCVLPFVRLAKANPRPKPSAFIFAGTYVAAFIYVIASIFFPAYLRGVLLVQTIGMLVMIAFFITYRKIVMPDLFAGQFRERVANIRAARQASRHDLQESLEKIAPK